MCDRLMAVKFIMMKDLVVVVSAYAPQLGCAEEEKEEFRTKLENLVNRSRMGSADGCVRDLNGHVGREVEGFAGTHGGFDFVSRNEEGGEDGGEDGNVNLRHMVQKEKYTPETYSSGGRTSQIDFVLVDREERGNIRN